MADHDVVYGAERNFIASEMHAMPDSAKIVAIR